MQNFSYCNPTRIVFGKGSIAKLPALIPSSARLLLTYGGGSIKRNGVYDQIKAALKDHTVFEFGGIEPNPQFATCMKAVDLVHSERIDFLLAAGGGSVLDGTKFIAAAARFGGTDPWDILTGAAVTDAVPMGTVLTLPATGSESNGTAVISNSRLNEKLFFGSELTYPKFSILDPEVTFTLPPGQTANGIVDAFVHVMEQYMTFDVNAPLQDRQAEAILSTLIEEGPKVLENPNDYGARANVMWCACQALNGLIACGVPQDWASHMIGHELTALYGIDHAQSLAVVLPGVLKNRIASKGPRLLQCGKRVFGIRTSSPERVIRKIESFFLSLGVKTRLKDYGIPSKAGKIVAQRLAARKMILGEKQDIDADAVITILKSRR
ncbi:MAG: iron-containing alcohol dehydrogenase [Kiritimatiellia bacterium]